MSRKGTTRMIGALCAAVMVLAAPAAVAQGPTVEGYSDSGPLGQIEEGGQAAGVIGGGGPGGPGDGSVVTTDGESRLPFTGLDLAIATLMGLALLGTGFAIRRTARAR